MRKIILGILISLLSILVIIESVIAINVDFNNPSSVGIWLRSLFAGLQPLGVLGSTQCGQVGTATCSQESDGLYWHYTCISTSDPRGNLWRADISCSGGCSTDGTTCPSDSSSGGSSSTTTTTSSSGSGCVNQGGYCTTGSQCCSGLACNIGTNQCVPSSNTCSQERIKKCSGDNIFTCSGGIWVPTGTTCQYGCSNGVCNCGNPPRGSSSQSCSCQGLLTCDSSNMKNLILCDGGTWQAYPCSGGSTCSYVNNPPQLYGSCSGGNQCNEDGIPKSGNAGTCCSGTSYINSNGVEICGSQPPIVSGGSQANKSSTGYLWQVCTDGTCQSCKSDNGQTCNGALPYIGAVIQGPWYLSGPCALSTNNAGTGRISASYIYYTTQDECSNNLNSSGNVIISANPNATCNPNNLLLNACVGITGGAQNIVGIVGYLLGGPAGGLAGFLGGTPILQSFKDICVNSIVDCAHKNCQSKFDQCQANVGTGTGSAMCGAKKIWCDVGVELNAINLRYGNFVYLAVIGIIGFMILMFIFKLLK